MIISKIEIENLGVFKNKSVIELDGKFSSIIGDNGTGKSTILFLIRFFLDPKVRKKGINENLIVDISKEFRVKIIFDLGIRNTDTHLNTLPIIEDNKIMVKISNSNNGEINIKEPKISLGEIEDIQYNIFQKLPFDDYIDLIYINSQYENNDEVWINKKFNDETIEATISSQILTNIDIANKAISEIKEIKKFKKEANDEMSSLFKDNEFNLELLSNIETKKIGKALRFFPSKDEKIIDSHGDGFNKIFSIIAKIKTNSNEGKESIIIIDELENHLFHSYQRQVIDHLTKMNINQLIIVTHSPHLITLIPNSSITKLRLKQDSSKFLIKPTNQFNYWQIDLFSAVFYEYIIMVEGHSEKIFYEYLLKTNDYFKKFISNKSIFIMCISGVDFSPKVELLKNLCKKIIILTDNDYWKPSKKHKLDKLMGLKRIYEIIKIYDNTYNIDEVNFDYDPQLSGHSLRFAEIVKVGQKYGIYTQSKIGHTFENSLLEERLIDENTKKILMKSKLKNLSVILEEISKKIDDKTIQESKYLFKWLRELS